MFVFMQKKYSKICILNLKNSRDVKNCLLFSGKQLKNSCDKKCNIFRVLCLYEFEYIENSQAISISLYKKQINF